MSRFFLDIICIHSILALMDAVAAPAALSGQDASFFAFESDRNPMHVGALAVCEAAGFSDHGGRLDVAAIRRELAERLGSVERLRQKPWRSPLLRRPVWVDDPEFRPEQHVHEIRLSPGCDDARIQELLGRLFAQRLDRSRPLWDAWVVTDLPRARHFLLFVKVHHSLLDGAAGVALLGALLSTQPQPTRATRRSRKPAVARPLPRRAAWIAAELRSLLPRTRARREQPPGTRARREQPPGTRARREQSSEASSERSRRDALRGLLRAAGLMARPLRKSTLNGPSSSERLLARCDVDLPVLAALAEAGHGTLNDALLACVAGAVDRWNSAREACSQVRLLCPVNMRSAGASAGLGNRLGALLVDLPLEAGDSHARIAAVRRITRRAKRSGVARGVELLGRLATFAPASLAAWILRAAGWLRTFNLVVTHVPGPPDALFFAGSRILSLTPFAPVFPHQRCSIAALRYAGRLHVGLTGAWERPEETRALAKALEASFADLTDELAQPPLPRREIA